MRHRDTVHKKGDKKFTCEMCPFKSHHKLSLKNHIKGVHDKVKDNVCGECDYTSSYKTTLKMHMERKHGTRAKKL